MSTLLFPAETRKNHASDCDALPFVSYPTTSMYRSQITGRIDTLHNLLQAHGNLNPGEQPSPDYMAWTHEEMLTWCFQAMESVALRDSGEKSECLWTSSQAYLATIIDLNPPGSRLHDSALTLVEDISRMFSSETRTADRDLYASRALKSVGLDIPVHFTDGEPSFFSISDLLHALQTRLKEEGFPFEVCQEDGEWVVIEDVSLDEEPAIQSSDVDEEGLLALAELFG